MIFKCRVLLISTAMFSSFAFSQVALQHSIEVAKEAIEENQKPNYSKINGVFYELWQLQQMRQGCFEPGDRGIKTSDPAALAIRYKEVTRRLNKSIGQIMNIGWRNKLSHRRDMELSLAINRTCQGVHLLKKSDVNSFGQGVNNYDDRKKFNEIYADLSSIGSGLSQKPFQNGYATLHMGTSFDKDYSGQGDIGYTFSNPSEFAENFRGTSLEMFMNADPKTAAYIKKMFQESE